jgi:hypothetical protein
MTSDSAFLAFATRFRLRVCRDGCGDVIVPGKFGHLYHHAPKIIGLVLEQTPNGHTTARTLLCRRRKALATGFRLHQAGDVESIFLFCSQNLRHEVLAVSLVGAKRRRISSPAQLEVLRRARLAFKKSVSLAQRPLQRSMNDVSLLREQECLTVQNRELFEL